MRNIRAQRGFTLVELLVAIGLFSIVVSIASGGFVQALRSQRRVIALIAANSNASLSLEQMAREIRTGFDFSCTGASSSCDELAFTNADGAAVRYRALDGAVERGVGGVSERITADNVDVRSLSFSILPNAAYPPRITVSLGVSVRGSAVELGMTIIQTTVSARQF